MTSARVKFNYEPQLEDELPLTKGEIIKILEKSTDGWWKGEVNGQTGWFPGIYVEEVEDVENREQEQVQPKIIKTPPTPAAANKPQKGPNAERPVLETVVAVWEFQGAMPEEISFSKGEHLDIIEKPQSDPEWWLARNSEGKSGLIPQNYVQSINVVAEEMADAWNFGQISRDDAERTLRLGKEGDFLVRDSESTKGDYSISVKTDSKLIRHFKIENKNGKLVIGGKTFTNMPDLIEHYTSHPIFVEGPEKLFLVRPAQR